MKCIFQYGIPKTHKDNKTHTKTSTGELIILYWHKIACTSSTVVTYGSLINIGVWSFTSASSMATATSELYQLITEKTKLIVAVYGVTLLHVYWATTPLDKGHIGTSNFVLCREIILFIVWRLVSGVVTLIDRLIVFCPSFMLSVLCQSLHSTRNIRIMELMFFDHRHVPSWPPLEGYQ